MPVVFRLQCFHALRARQNGAPFKMIYIYIYYIFQLIFLYGIVLLFFFKFDFGAFLNFHTEIYCVILSSCTESGSNAVYRMTSLLGNVFPNAGPMCGPWVSVGSLHKGPVIQRYICPRLIHFALFFLLTSVKRQPLSNNIQTVIRFRVGYAHLSLILIKKTANATRKKRKTYLGMTMRSLGFQNFQQCCFRLPDWWYNSTHCMGRLFLANILMTHLNSFCLVIPLAGPSAKLGPQLFRLYIWACSSGTNYNNFQPK